MLDILLTPDAFSNIKDTLGVSVYEAGPARRAEAAARGLGFDSHATLRAAFATGPRTATVDGAAFASFLPEAGEDADGRFAAACAVQAIRQGLSGYPGLAFGPLVDLMESGPVSWASPEARVSAEDFIALVTQLGKPAFLRKVGRYPSALAIATAAPRHTKGLVRIPAAIAAAIHVGLPLLPERIWENGIPAFLVIPTQPGTVVPYPDWVGRLLARGEGAADEARMALRTSLGAGSFDEDAAETLVQALWCRAFGNHLDQEGLPDWRTYGRMLLADPDLTSIGAAFDGRDTAGRARAGLEKLCGGGPIKGLKAGYAHVFEGDLKELLDKSGPLARPVRAKVRPGARKARTRSR